MKLNELIKINESICKASKYPSDKRGLDLLIECMIDNELNLIELIDVLKNHEEASEQDKAALYELEICVDDLLTNDDCNDCIELVEFLESER